MRILSVSLLVSLVLTANALVFAASQTDSPLKDDYIKLDSAPVEAIDGQTYLMLEPSPKVTDEEAGTDDKTFRRGSVQKRHCGRRYNAMICQ